MHKLKTKQFSIYHKFNPRTWGDESFTLLFHQIQIIVRSKLCIYMLSFFVGMDYESLFISLRLIIMAATVNKLESFFCSFFLSFVLPTFVTKYKRFLNGSFCCSLSLSLPFYHSSIACRLCVTKNNFFIILVPFCVCCILACKSV